MQPPVLQAERMLTELDFARLTSLVGRQVPSDLEALLDGAEVTASRAVPANVVTMYSRVEVVDVHTHRRQVLTLCYPGDAEPAAGFISVLSPVGSGLIGLTLGQVARWLTPTGEEGAAEIVAILFQPEASGDYLT